MYIILGILYVAGAYCLLPITEATIKSAVIVQRIRQLTSRISPKKRRKL